MALRDICEKFVSQYPYQAINRMVCGRCETRSASDFRGNGLEKRYDAFDVTPASRLTSPFDLFDISMIDTHIFKTAVLLNNDGKFSLTNPVDCMYGSLSRPDFVIPCTDFSSYHRQIIQAFGVTPGDPFRLNVTLSGILVRQSSVYTVQRTRRSKTGGIKFRGWDIFFSFSFRNCRFPR